MTDFDYRLANHAIDDREKLPAASPLDRKAALDRQDREQSAGLRREAAVPPSPVAPLARPVPASPPQQPKPATSTLLPKMPLPPHLQPKGLACDSTNKLAQIEFAADSLLEEAGFELSVPPERKAALDRVRGPSVTRQQASLIGRLEAGT